MNLELMPFTELIDRAVAPARASMRWLLLALPLALLGMAMFVAQATFYTRMAEADLGTTFFAAFGGMMVAVLVYSLWLVQATAAVGALAFERIAERPLDIGAALVWTFSPRVLFTMLLTVVVLTVSFMLCLLPFFLIAPMLGLVVPVMREEKLFGVAALRRSWDLVRFNSSGRWADSGWLFMSGILFIGWALSASLGLIVQLPLIGWQQYLTFSETLAGNTVDPAALMNDYMGAYLLAQVTSALAQGMALIYLGYATGLFYFEVRRRREAYDLEAAVAELTAPVGSTA